MFFLFLDNFFSFILCDYHDNEIVSATRCIYFTIFLENRLHEAGYFHAMSQKSQLNVDLVLLSERVNDEDPTAPIKRAMDEIRTFEPDIILLYTKKENFEIMLQQVIIEFTRIIINKVLFRIKDARCMYILYVSSDSDGNSFAT